MEPDKFTVVGVTYLNQDGSSRQAAISVLKTGDGLQLVRDFHNPYDGNAIKVITLPGKQIGFVPAEIAAQLAARIDAGLRLLCHVDRITCKANRYGCRVRIHEVSARLTRDEANTMPIPVVPARNVHYACRDCGQILSDKPRIDVEGSIYCYKCSKQIVEALEKARNENATRSYQLALSQYESEKAAFERHHGQWHPQRAAYIRQNERFGCFAGLALFAIAAALAYQIAPALVVPSALISFWIWSMVGEKESERLSLQFVSLDCNNAEPTFTLARPAPPSTQTVLHRPVLDQTNVTYSRTQILHRDEHCCQWCGGKSSENESLEIHHIIPKAAGGIDDPTNLISLCSYCHDQETWYGHRRAYRKRH